MTLPTREEARAIVNQKQDRRDKYCIDSICERIRDLIQEEGDFSMTIPIPASDFYDETQCNSVMQKVSTMLKEKGFDTDWERRENTRIDGSEY